jgi:hypothetical protein
MNLEYPSSHILGLVGSKGAVTGRSVRKTSFPRDVLIAS